MSLPPVIDPTKNVEALVAAEGRRQDDLRAAEGRRQDDLRVMSEEHRRSENEHITDLVEKGDNHSKDLRLAESNRIDALLESLSTTATATTSAAEIRAKTLQAEVTANAEALRQQVEATAKATQAEQLRIMGPMQADIREGRKFQDQVAGQRTQVVETRDVGYIRALWIGLGVTIFMGLSSLTVMILIEAITIILYVLKRQ